MTRKTDESGKLYHENPIIKDYSETFAKIYAEHLLKYNWKPEKVYVAIYTPDFDTGGIKVEKVRFLLPQDFWFIKKGK
jgi:hypothetical protein